MVSSPPMRLGPPACGVVVAIALMTALAGSAQATVTYTDLPMCDQTTTSMCVQDFEVDVDGTGTFGPAPAGIAPEATVILDDDPAVGIPAQVIVGARTSGHSTELSPTLSAVSTIKIVVDVGTIVPTRFAFGQANIQQLSQSTSSNGDTILSAVIKPVAISTGVPCSVDSCAPSTVIDEPAVATVTFNEITAPTPAQQEFDSEAAGAWVSSDAPAMSDVFIDSATQSLSVQIAAPHLTGAGAVNLGFLQGFVPDALITGFFQTDAATLVANGVLTASDAGTTQTTQATISAVPGGVLFEAQGFHFSAPTFTLSLRPARPTLSLGVTPARDTKPPWVFTATGGLTTRAAMSRVRCTGTVRVSASAGSRILARATTAVRWVRGRCVYGASLRFTNRRHATRATVSASYLGSTGLRAVTATRSVTVRLV